MEFDDLDKLIIISHGIDNVPFLTKFKFQKMIFLSILALSKDKEDAIKKLEDAAFYPHKYGPYSEYVEEKRIGLEREGILVELREGKDLLSKRGRKIFNILKKEIGDFKIAILQNIKEIINTLVNDRVLALLVYDIAERYGYVLNSEILEEVEKNRIKYAIFLYRRGIISKERAAELAKMSLFNFSSFLMRLRDL